VGLRDLVYRLYERRLETKLSKDSIPRHVGVIIDGNRRWARAMGMRDVATGHRKGADKISELLGWCRDTGVEVVTVWMLSNDNLNRPREELEANVLKNAKEVTSHRPGLIVNVAVGYGGRREIADAVRSLLQEHASKGASIEDLVEVLDVEHIAHPDLGRAAVVRLHALAERSLRVLLPRGLLA
jgi:short-chain Z-isoprenyl diphosphate synthase